MCNTRTMKELQKFRAPGSPGDFFSFFTAAHTRRILRRLLNFWKICAVLYSPTSSPALFVYTQMASVTTQMSSVHRQYPDICDLCTNTQNSLCGGEGLTVTVCHS
jgi:hypothetical protein